MLYSNNVKILGLYSVWAFIYVFKWVICQRHSWKILSVYESVVNRIPLPFSHYFYFGIDDWFCNALHVSSFCFVKGLFPSYSLSMKSYAPQLIHRIEHSVKCEPSLFPFVQDENVSDIKLNKFVCLLIYPRIY